jgi:hypothetical protein
MNERILIYPLLPTRMHYLSMMKYSIGFLVANELDGLTFSCPNNDGAINLGALAGFNTSALDAMSPNIYWYGFAHFCWLSPFCSTNLNLCDIHFNDNK